MKRVGIVALAVLLVLGLATWGVMRAVDAQRPKGTDLDQLRQMLYDGERAAEQRNAVGVTQFISDDYQDDMFNADRARWAVRDWMRRSEAIELDIPGDSIVFQPGPDGKSGTLEFLLRSVQRVVGFPVPLQMQITLRVGKERVYYYWIVPGEEWRVTGASGYQGFIE